jgi:hypothetical protein
MALSKCHAANHRHLPSTTALNAKKKIDPSPAPKQERKQLDGLGLIFLYMTPWKNPNSIFVYMLLILYCLGKYSETHATASGAL